MDSGGTRDFETIHSYSSRDLKATFSYSIRDFEPIDSG
jgi:hypothetical protein